MTVIVDFPVCAVAPARAAAKLIAALGLALVVASCATSNELGPLNDEVFVGITRVHRLASPDGVLVYSQSTLGAGLDGGSGFLGWRGRDAVEADASKCQLIVIIRTTEDTPAVTTLIEKLKGERICVADFPR